MSDVPLIRTLVRPAAAGAIEGPIGVEHGLRYVITGPDGTRAVINDSTDPDYVGFLNPFSGGGVSGLERSGVREVYDLLPEADGGVHGDFLSDRLAFTLGGIIEPVSPVDPVVTDTWLGRQARLLRATRARRADALLEWEPSEGPPVRLLFREQQATRISGARPKTFLIAGVSEASAVESQELHVTALTPSAVTGGGYSFPLAFPMTSTDPVAGALTVTNAGSVDAWPELTITGPCTNPNVLNADLGLGLFLTYTLAAGESLVIDTDPRRRTVKLNGDTNRYSAVDWTRSAWWPLLPGDNDLRLGFTTYSAPASLEVRHRDAWG